MTRILNERIDLASTLVDNYGMEKKQANDFVRNLSFSDYLEITQLLKSGKNIMDYINGGLQEDASKEVQVLMPGDVVKSAAGNDVELGQLKSANNGNVQIQTKDGMKQVPVDAISSPDEKELTWMKTLAGIKK